MDQHSVTHVVSRATTSTWLLLAILLTIGAVSGAPVSSHTLITEAGHLQENIRVIKVGTLQPFIQDYRSQRYFNDASMIDDLEKMAVTSYSTTLQMLPELSNHEDFAAQLHDLLRQTHENLAWTSLWLRHVASQEALHEHGFNYRLEFITLEQLAGQLMVDLELMAHNLDIRPLTLQLKDLRLDNAPEFSKTSVRRQFNYMKIHEFGLLLTTISERFITLEIHANAIWRR